MPVDGVYYIMSKARCIGRGGSIRKNHGAMLRLRTGLAAAAGAPNRFYPSPGSLLAHARNEPPSPTRRPLHNSAFGSAAIVIQWL